MLGAFRALNGSHASTRFQSQKTGTLLAYLAYYSKQSHSRELLVDLLWPEVELESGLSRLKNLLWLLKQELCSEIPFITASRSVIQLDCEACSTDVEDFFGYLQAAEKANDPVGQIVALTRAVQLQQGDLLPGRYEDWVLQERQRVIDIGIQARVELACLHRMSGDPEAGLSYARFAVGCDPMREDSQLELMRIYAALNKPQEALRQYRELERILWDEIGEEPSAALKLLEDSIRHQRREIPDYAVPIVMKRAIALKASEPIGGAMPLCSTLYIERSTDPIFLSAVSRRESIVLAKGPRQTGKTSLLARAMEHARSSGMSVLTTDLHKINLSQLETIEGFYRACAEMLAEQLEIETTSISTIGMKAGPNIDFERFLRREVLSSWENHFFWALDDVDRLAAYDYRSEVFGLFRSWHNDRALKPDAPWNRLTLGVTYATEAHLLISDQNQSPFNVGVSVTLQHFNPDEIADLNRRHGEPLGTDAELARFYELLGGAPYLVRRGLYEMVTANETIQQLEERLAGDQAPFQDHLRRMAECLESDPLLLECTRAILREDAHVDQKGFLRLRSAGVVAGDNPRSARISCALYKDFLMERLTEGTSRV